MEAMQGGDLYQLQQEAISRARETAKKATSHDMTRSEKMPAKPSVLSSENMIILAVLALLIFSDCNDIMLIVALALVLFL